MISFLPPFLDNRLGKFLLLLVILSIPTLSAEPAFAQDQETSQVKAAFLFNFAKFVEWPSGTFSDDRAAITLCLFDRDPMAAALTTLQGKVVQGRTLLVKRCHNTGELKGCHIFFASVSQKAELAQALAVLRDLPVLTVTDTVDNFAKLGGIINLTPAEDKIRFEICEINARKSRLKISSQLLKLAIMVNN